MEPPLRQHPYPSQSMSLQRRYSFSTSATAEIEQSRSSGGGPAESPSRSPRKSASFSSLSDTFRLDLGGRLQSSFEPRLSPVHSPERGREAPSGLACGGEDSDDDSDENEDGDVDSGGEYSSAMSDDDSLASPSSSVVPSPVKEVAGLVSPASLHKPLESNAVALQTERGEVAFELKPTAAAVDQPSPATPQSSSAGDGASHRIEQEIRHAIDSAAARVQEELGRREEFESELRSALTHQPPAADEPIRRTSFPLHEDVEFDALVASLLQPSSSGGSPPTEAREKEEQVQADDADLLLLMEVVIGQGRSDTIRVHAGDEPDVLAANFAARHSLQPEAVPTLSRHIQEQLDALSAAEKEATSDSVDDASSWKSSSNSVDMDGHASEPASGPKGGGDGSSPDSRFLASPPPAPTSPSSPEAAHYPSFGHYIKDHELAAPKDGGVEGEAQRLIDGQERENQREFSYNCLMAKYGHYSQHSGKVDPVASAAASKAKPDALTMRNIELAERTRVVDSGRGSSSLDRGRPGKTSAGPVARAATGTPARRAMPTMTTAAVGGSKKKKKKPAPAPVFQRLFALAETKDKWLQRAQRAKAADEEREQDELLQLAASARAARSGSRDGGLGSSGGGGGGYAHAGERLYEEALADLAKKDKLRAQRAVEREQQEDWMCPKCAFVNHHNDDWCKHSASIGAKPDTHSSVSPRRESLTATATATAAATQRPSESVCGQPKPAHLFRPTLLTAPAGVARAISRNKDKAAAASRRPSAGAASSAAERRERSQRALEDAFRRACPFKPTINGVSEEIVREKLESEARAAGLTASAVRSPADAAELTGELTGELLRRRQRRDPHLALYEDAFQARANREAREREYMAQFPFKPDIGVNALWAPVDASREAFVERLAVAKYREMERRREALVDKHAPRGRDPDTGRALFKPEVGRGPAFNRNERKLPIGEFLFEAHREHQAYLQRLQAQHELEVRQHQSRGFVSDASRVALERRKHDTCTRIFDALLKLQREGDRNSDRNGSGDGDGDLGSGGDGDGQSLGCYVTAVDDTREPHDEGDDAAPRADRSPSRSAKTPEKEEAPRDGDGENNGRDGSQVVTPRRVDLSRLPAEIGRVVAIIFAFARYEELSRSAFAAHMDTLVAEVPGLTYTQVLFLADLLGDGKGSRRRFDAQGAAASTQAQEDEELTFRPTIDSHSRAIATKHGRADRAKVFQALNQYFDHYEKKRAQTERQRQREFDRAHPFQPTLVTKRQERQRAAEGFYERIAQLDEAQRGPPAPSGPPLPTAIANARPSVRPIDSDDPPLVASQRSSFQGFSAASSGCMAEGASGSDGKGNVRLGPDEEEDAELTSRVLAALDEAHAADAGADASASLAKISALVREGATLTAS